MVFYGFAFVYSFFWWFSRVSGFLRFVSGFQVDLFL